MSSNPVQLPEILLQILGYLQHDKFKSSLRKASQVNLLWFEVATEILWRNIPPVTALINVEPSRRHIYADKVDSLLLFGSENHNSLQNVVFPRLRSLFAYMSYALNENELRVDQYFQPTLVEICLHSDIIAELLLDRTSSELPSLRKIEIGSLPSNVDASRFLAFLRNFSSLTSIEFNYETGDIITDEGLQYLMSQENLLHLKLGRYYRPETIENAIALSSPPFKNLRALNIRVESKSVLSLIQATSSGLINDLTVYVQDHTGSILNHISSVMQLQSLRVIYHKFREISQQEIMSLQSLRQLHTLELLSGEQTPQSLEVKDRDVQQLTAHLRGLRIFALDIKCELSIKAIVAIAKNCPGLERLELLGGYDLQTLAHSQEMLFPALKELVLDNARVKHLQVQYVPSCHPFLDPHEELYTC